MMTGRIEDLAERIWDELTDLPVGDRLTARDLRKRIDPDSCDKTSREIRRAIAYLSHTGLPVVSDKNGYCVVRGAPALVEYAQNLQARARSLMERAAAVLRMVVYRTKG